jgi:hypothetical protein
METGFMLIHHLEAEGHEVVEVSGGREEMKMLLQVCLDNAINITDVSLARHASHVTD